jgi:hypothetical protein
MCIGKWNSNFDSTPVNLIYITGVEMLKLKMYNQIQLLKRQGYLQTEISKKLKIDSKTSSKYYKMNEDEYRSYQKSLMFRDKVLFQYEKEILEVYEQNEYKKLNMSALYDYLEEKYGTLPCNEKTLRNYISYLLKTGKLKLKEEIRTYSKVPELPLGKQMQLDFGEYRCKSGLKLYIFVAVLSASRYKYVSFQDHPFKTLEVIHHLLDCFDYFGGISQEMVIDQDKLLVSSENSGDIIYTKDFKYFIEECSIKMYVCRKSDPETKGKIENVVKYVKGNFLSIRNFKMLKEANIDVLKWLKRRANGKISQSTKQIPGILIEKERVKLRPILNSIYRKDTLRVREKRTVNEKACISVKTCRYQLPTKYRNITVEVYITKQKLFVFDHCTGKEIISYELSLIPGKVISKREYKREKQKTAKELKSQVINMFSEEKWNCFVARNFQSFPRYVRDQCIEAKRYFLNDEIDSSILNQALQYCLENETPSFANLNDTYTHFKKEHENRDESNQNISPSSEVLGHQNVHKTLPVSSRNLNVYRDLVGDRGVEHETL